MKTASLSAPAEFQRSMEECLWGLHDDICLPFLDDNLVHSKYFTDHVEHVRTVLQQYQKQWVKLTPKKCEISKPRDWFLGRIVSKEGHSMDPAEVAPVQALKGKWYRSLIYNELHKNMGHLSTDRNLNLIRVCFFWPQMQRDIEHLVTNV